MANRDRRKIKFDELIREGENPLGFTAQTPNGTAHATGQGWNKKQPVTRPQVEEGGAWGGKNSNRTGE